MAAKSWRDYAGIIAEAKTDAGSWREVVEDPPMTYQQANDAAAHIRKHYAVEHNLTVLVRSHRVFVRANK
jgi:hypothetical protein